jgi:hypothetical protein
LVGHGLGAGVEGSEFFRGQVGEFVEAEDGRVAFRVPVLDVVIVRDEDFESILVRGFIGVVFVVLDLPLFEEGLELFLGSVVLVEVEAEVGEGGGDEEESDDSGFHF